MATCKTTVHGLIQACSLTLSVSFPLFCHPEVSQDGRGIIPGEKESTSFSYFSVSSFLSILKILSSVVLHTLSSGGFRRSQELPTLLLEVRNLCKRPAATQRDVTDGRINVLSADGSPTWRGIRELEAELWK